MSARALRAASATALALAAAGCGAKTGLLVPPPPVEIALGGSHSCARMPDRTVRCWGRNDHGELGDGTTTTRTRPTEVRALADVEQVAIGSTHACALLRDGTVRCWGANPAGMLGDGTQVDHALPAPVPGLTGATRIAVGGTESSCAVLRDGTVRCWGNDGWRAHAVPDGDGGATFTRDDNDVCLVLPLRPDAGPTGFSCRLSPRLVRGLDDATDVALGGEEACALRRGGTVRCWGTIDRGPAIASMELAAVPLAGLHDIVQIALSETSGCALDRRGVVRCWGNLGGGAAGPDGPTPFALSPLDDAVAIALGADYVCALRRDGAVRCLNPFTLLLGAELDVPSLRGARSVASGFAHVCATFGGDTVRCLGSNPFGQLGTGTVEDSVASAVDVRW